MSTKNILLHYHTLKYLKFKQIYFRIFYVIKNKLFLNHPKRIQLNSPTYKLNLPYLIEKNVFFHQPCRFTFLNQTTDFNQIQDISWNFSKYGKLWTYNLNYFDFLLQPHFEKEDGIQFILNYIESIVQLRDGLEPYPTSLRNINWVKFLSKHNIQNDKVDQFLYDTYHHLMKNLEYHLLGNHLLENAFSLLFGAYYFQNEEFYRTAKKLLLQELNEQTLTDGGHFELSPMYHQILLERLLDGINLTKNNWNKTNITPFLEKKTQSMLSWLSQITFQNGEIPHVNDSTYGIAPSSASLLAYAKALKVTYSHIPLSASGYRMIKNDIYELFIDAGNIGPDYIPGHAHSDTFNFLLNIRNQPAIIDTGISTYEKNAQRHYERSTIAHNTVVIDDHDQSQVWGGFRVAKRAKISSMKSDKNSLSACHDGYERFGITHCRQWNYSKNEITILDRIEPDKNSKCEAFLHFAPGLDLHLANNCITAPNFLISFENCLKVQLEPCSIAQGFNKTIPSQKAAITFSKKLKTVIHLQ